MGEDEKRIEDGWTDTLPWIGQYVLDEQGNAVPATGLLSWARWLEEYERHVADDQIGEARVSTVFLGLGHGWHFLQSNPLTYKPVLWETMIFGGPYDLQCWRYTSKEDALEGHRRAVQMLTS
jgi:hypothetical protein